MTESQALDLLRRTLWVVLQVGGPLLAVSLVVGMAVSLLAALTQIQEVTLTFLPKAIAMAVTALVLGPWMLKNFVAFAAELYAQAARLAAAGH
jgi:flagellar biosynthetic protein FliQ